MRWPNIKSSWTVDEFGVRPIWMRWAPRRGVMTVKGKACKACGARFVGVPAHRYCAEACRPSARR